MPWEDDARCRLYDPEIFFVPRVNAERRAKAICVPCPVKAECLSFALESRVEFGVWGGLNARDRRKLLRASAKEEAWGRSEADDAPLPGRSVVPA